MEHHQGPKQIWFGKKKSQIIISIIKLYALIVAKIILIKAKINTD